MAVLASKKTDIPDRISHMFPEECARGSFYDQLGHFPEIGSRFKHYFVGESGISSARNLQIHHFMLDQDDWMVVVDGDVLPPHGLLETMVCEDADIVGLDIPHCCEVDHFDLSAGNMVSSKCCHSYLPTRFACFQRDFLNKGFFYPEVEPFNKPGWGAEDNLAGVFAWLLKARIKLFSGVTYHHAQRVKTSWDEVVKKRVVAWLAIAVLMNDEERLRIMRGEHPVVTIDEGVPKLNMSVPSWLHFEEEDLEYTPEEDSIEQDLVMYFNYIKLDGHVLIGWSSSTTPG
jgi:hypothetical protein